MTERTDKKSADDVLENLLGNDSPPPEAKKNKSTKKEPEEDEWEKPGKKVSGKDLTEDAVYDKPSAADKASARKGLFSVPKSAHEGKEEDDAEELFAGMLKSTPKMVVILYY